MSGAPAALDRFRAIVLADPDLLHELRQCNGRPAFVACVLERARERGCAVEQAEVEAALNAETRTWTTRWIDQ